jgi:hypothetical protein
LIFTSFPFLLRKGFQRESISTSLGGELENGTAGLSRSAGNRSIKRPGSQVKSLDGLTALEDDAGANVGLDLH